ncbi:MAG TPA: methyltransferase domain-containing protein [Acidimicrobiales bacterium]|jgi:SAM-dependent methyltransferase|nr:methyltransferase domain-containing protein [Acidimicrobiales bacterium]
MATVKGALRRLRGAPLPPPWAGRWRSLSRLSAQQALDVVYELILSREPDPTGTGSYLGGLQNGTITPQEVAQWAVASGEWWSVTPFPGLGQSLHFSRMVFVRSLPAARRILDLGGTALGNATGALVLMGYPYPFDDLVVIDLPSEERNALYQEDTAHAATQTALGPVRYRYHSMVDLSDYADGSVDLVYSGQSIEHVPLDVADTVLSEVRRVLRPGGYLALDTPNARVTRLQQDEFIDPDHEHEYTHAELHQKLTRAGFDVVESKGLNYAGPSLDRGRFDAEEIATARGLFSQIEDCYLLAYLCQVPE